ncbi:MAG: hypothetical protein ACT4PT_00020 [Methanobacteriota archaeon]
MRRRLVFTLLALAIAGSVLLPTASARLRWYCAPVVYTPCVYEYSSADGPFECEDGWTSVYTIGVQAWGRRWCTDQGDGAAFYAGALGYGAYWYSYDTWTSSGCAIYVSGVPQPVPCAFGPGAVPWGWLTP